jgi:hypothetical protein
MQSAALEKLKQQLEDPDSSGFEMHLRIEGEWDQTKFERLMTCLEDALTDLSGETFVPRWLAAWFCWAPDWIARNATGDAFLQRRPAELSRDEYAALVRSGLRRLNDAVRTFSDDHDTARSRS